MPDGQTRCPEGTLSFHRLAAHPCTAPRKHDLISRRFGDATRLRSVRQRHHRLALNGALRRGEFTYRVYCFARD
jgi:hypothetical protein